MWEHCSRCWMELSGTLVKEILKAQAQLTQSPIITQSDLQGTLMTPQNTVWETTAQATSCNIVQRLLHAICLPFQYRYNILTRTEAQNVYDARYYGGQCETVYNGEWRELRYDSTCERLYYGDDEKYFRKPYNFLMYRFEVSLNGTLKGEAYWGRWMPCTEDFMYHRVCRWLKVPLHLPPISVVLNLLNATTL